MDHKLESVSENISPVGKPVRIMFCKLCGGTPGKVIGTAQIARTLTSECPGVKMTDEQQSEISMERLDFKGGQWIRNP